MSAFKGLFWKELKISKVDLYTELGIMLLIFIGAFSASRYYQEPYIMASIFIFVYVAHIWHLPVFILSSLRREGKTQLWLHNPNRGSSLLTAKLAAGLSYYFLSLFIAFLTAFWAVDQVIIPALPVEFSGQGLKALLIAALFITGMTIYYSIWLQFYWTLYHALKNLPNLKKFRWPIIFVLWSVLTAAGMFFQTTSFFEKINNTAVIRIELLKKVSFEFKQAASGILSEMGTIHISLVTVLLYLLVTVLVFLLSVWLLERKVEV